MSADCLREIRKEMKKFTNSKPSSGFDIEYLEKAKEILDLYSEANTIIEETGVRDSEEILEIYEKVKFLVQ